MVGHFFALGGAEKPIDQCRSLRVEPDAAEQDRGRTVCARWDAARLSVHRASKDRALRRRTCVSAANPCEASFADWSKTEAGNPSALDLPGPEIFDWTPMGQFSSVVINGDENSFDNRLRIYRLNDMDATYDWYMVLRDPVSTPRYYHCVPSAHCGWYTEKRDFQFSIPAAELQSGVSLYDWSPKQPIGSSSGQLTLGLSPHRSGAFSRRGIHLQLDPGGR